MKRLKIFLIVFTITYLLTGCEKNTGQKEELSVFLASVDHIEKLKSICIKPDKKELKLLAILFDYLGMTYNLKHCSKFVDEISLYDNLELKGKSITELSLFQHLVGLEYLDLSHNPIESIEALENLTKLRALNIESTFIEDLSPLGKLDLLEVLALGSPKLKNISVLENIRNLREISFRLSNNQDLDIIPLKRAKHLKWVRINDCKFKIKNQADLDLNIKKLTSNRCQNKVGITNPEMDKTSEILER